MFAGRSNFGQEAALCFRNEKHQTMSGTTSDTDTRTTNRIVASSQQEIRLSNAEHTAGTITRPPRRNRIHHVGNNPRQRPPYLQRSHRRALSPGMRLFGLPS